MKDNKVAAQIVVASIQKRAKPFLNALNKIEKVNTADEYSKVALLISNIKELSKLAEAEQETIMQPLKQAVKAVAAHFKPFADLVAQQELAAKAMMLKFLELQEHRSEKLLSDFEVGKIKKLETVVNKQAKIKDLDNSIATVRKVKIVEILDERKIPREYLRPDLVAIKEAFAAGKSVAGCQLSTKNSIAI